MRVFQAKAVERENGLEVIGSQYEHYVWVGFEKIAEWNFGKIQQDVEHKRLLRWRWYLEEGRRYLFCAGVLVNDRAPIRQ